MKLSFSLSSSKPSSSKPYHNFNNDDDDDHDPNRSAKPNNKEYVTEFDSSKTLNSSNNNLVVIPPKPNEWRPHKKMKNLDLPLHEQQPSSQLCFEVESSAPPDSAPNDISYGLNLRSNYNNNNNNNNNNKNFEERPPLPPPPVETVMLEKLKDDLERLPDDLGMDEFVDRPVEGYGAALLAGYGWYEGRGIGRNAKEDVKVVQYERRTNKEGLGFVSDIISTSDKKKEKNGKVEERSRRSSSSRGEEKGQFSVGKDVRIIGGSRDVGMKGNIVEVVGHGDSVVLKLLRSDEKVEVRIRNIAELGSVEEERCLRKLKELKIHGGSKHDNDRRSSTSLEEKRMIDNKHSRERTKDSSSLSRRSLGKAKVKEDGIQDKRMDNKRSREHGRSSEQRGEPRTASQVSWLTSHIRVRIISKELKGGRLYLKKGEVLDVVGPTSCDICMDDSRELIQGVDQDCLETALPRHGGAVLVLYGKHKGAYGSLVERDAENETGVVRDADTHELLNVQLEQIAEYVGDPSYIGY